MSTRYDWSSVPEWVTHIATDADGEAYGYDREPDLIEGIGSWDIDVSERMFALYSREYCEDWRDSLEARPVAE